MAPLTSAQRRALRARAHALHPVVAVGHHGLTPAVLKEIDVALRAHELVKVRVFGDDRAARDALLEAICAAVGCAPVQHIGKLLVVWRPAPADAKVDAPVRARPERRARKPAAAAKPPPAASPATSATRTPPRSSADRVPSAAAARRRQGGTRNAAPPLETAATRGDQSRRRRRSTST